MTSQLTHLPYGDIDVTNITIDNFLVSTQFVDAPLSGDTVQVTGSMVLLYPANCLSTLTIVFPSPVDGLTVTLVSHRPITTLTIENASFENGAISSLSSHTPVKFVYTSGSESWWAC